MQAFHASCCDLGTLLQQWLGAQISSKTAPGSDASPLGSLNPAPVPDPICLVVGEAGSSAGGSVGKPVCPSLLQRHVGRVEGTGKGTGTCHSTGEPVRDYGCGCTRLCQGTGHPQAPAAPVMGTQPLVSGWLLPRIKNGLGQPQPPSKPLKSPKQHFSRTGPASFCTSSGATFTGASPGSAPVPQGHGPLQQWVGDEINCLSPLAPWGL